jgi:hypothetical protein
MHLNGVIEVFVRVIVFAVEGPLVGRWQSNSSSSALSSSAFRHLVVIEVFGLLEVERVVVGGSDEAQSERVFLGAAWFASK